MPLSWGIFFFDSPRLWLPGPKHHSLQPLTITIFSENQPLSFQHMLLECSLYALVISCFSPEHIRHSVGLNTLLFTEFLREKKRWRRESLGFPGTLEERRNTDVQCQLSQNEPDSLFLCHMNREQAVIKFRGMSSQEKEVRHIAVYHTHILKHS